MENSKYSEQRELVKQEIDFLISDYKQSLWSNEESMKEKNFIETLKSYNPEQKREAVKYIEESIISTEPEAKIRIKFRSILSKAREGGNESSEQQKPAPFSILKWKLKIKTVSWFRMNDWTVETKNKEVTLSSVKIIPTWEGNKFIAELEFSGDYNRKDIKKIEIQYSGNLLMVTYLGRSYSYNIDNRQKLIRRPWKNGGVETFVGTDSIMFRGEDLELEIGNFQQ